MERYALQLKISLVGIKPLIWRRIVINADITLYELHEVIQTIMNWNNSHLHRFYNKHQIYMMPFDDCDISEQLAQIEAYEEALIEDILTTKGEHLKYEYDFGDSWVHDILVEKILPPIDGERDVIFITGKNATPPDECGGIFGYERLREIMSNPKHPEYNEMADWLGLRDNEKFDPTAIGYTAEEFNDIFNYTTCADAMLEKMIADGMHPEEFMDSIMDAISKLKNSN